MRRSPRFYALALLAWLLHVAGSAFALDDSNANIAALVERAEGSEEPLEAIDALAALHSGPATQALVELLREGLPDASVDRILERLLEAPRRSAFEALEAAAQHRRVEARVLALRGIAALAAKEPSLDARASKVFASALSDSDARVRGAAASALAQRFERIEHGQNTALRNGAVTTSLITPLLRATARGVPEAARAAGLATPEAQLSRLHDALHGLPLTATLDAYDAVLARGSVSDAAKLDVLARLGEIATPATKAFLVGLITERRFPASSALQRALLETEKRIQPRSAGEGARP